MTLVPRLQDLLANYLEQAAAAPAGLVGEVEPYQAMLPAWTEPRAVWGEALRAAQLLVPAARAIAWQPGHRPMEAAWAKLLSESGMQAAVVFCLGNVPQLLSDVAPLLAQGYRALKLPVPRPDPNPAPEQNPGQQTWEENLWRCVQWRMSGRLGAAQSLLREVAAQADPDHSLLVRNETAALAWHKGEIAEAVRLWSTFADHPVAAFNLGLAALCQGDPVTAMPHWQRAAAALPESDPWHHLAQLYHTLC